MFNEDYDANRDFGQISTPFQSRGGRLLYDSHHENQMQNVALLGYSRGGGSVWETSAWNFNEDVADPWEDNGPEMTIVQSVYFDAVRETSLTLVGVDADGDGHDDPDWWRPESEYPGELVPWSDEGIDVHDEQERRVVLANPEQREPVKRPVDSGEHYHIFQAPATWPADHIADLPVLPLVIVARGGPLAGQADEEGWLQHVERHGEVDELVNEKNAVTQIFLDGVSR
jgi:hypothetical protein